MTKEELFNKVVEHHTTKEMEAIELLNEFKKVVLSVSNSAENQKIYLGLMDVIQKARYLTDNFLKNSGLPALNHPIFSELID